MSGRVARIVLCAAGPLANANYAYDSVISLALADDYAKTTNGTTVAHDMTSVTNPPGTAVTRIPSGCGCISDRVIFVTG